MAAMSSALDAEAMARAKALLVKSDKPESMWPALSAAGFLALAALTFATAMLLAPPLTSEHVARERGAE